MDIIRIQGEDFSLDAEYQRHRRIVLSGAIVTFSGLVRDFNTSIDEEPVDSLYLQHYPGMTESLLQNIVSEARERWPLDAVTVIHRVGSLNPGDQIVLAIVSASHRAEAFSAASFLMDYLKTRATFWKKTISGSNTRWLEMKDSDRESARHWQSGEVSEGE